MNIAAMILPLLLAAFQPPFDPHLNLEKDQLKGPVKLVKIEVQRYETVSGEPKLSAPRLYIIKMYDRDGLLSQESVFDRDTGLATATSTYKHDQWGNLLTWRSINKKGETQYRQVFLYDKKENHADRKAIGEEFYNDKGARTKTWTYSFDEKGRKNGVEFRSDEGKRSVTAYNYGDHVITMRSEEWRDGEWSLTLQRTYKMNDENERTEEISQRTLPNGDTQLTKYKYNDDGLLVEEEQSTGEFLSKAEYSYTFDGRGNWITKTKTQHSISKKDDKRFTAVTRIERRTIEYYLGE